MDWGFIIFWIGINSLIGFAIGQKKNAVGGSIALCVILGPIGWLIAALDSGNVRKCPFCAENVKYEAVVCPHCQRDLPPIPAPKPVPQRTPKQIRREKWIVGTIVALVLGIIGWAALDATGRNRARAEEEQRTEEVRKLQSSSSTPPITFERAPEFIAITSEVSIFDNRDTEIKLAPGIRLQVIERYPHDVTVLWDGAHYSIPTAFTTPTR
jgi:hypothetical protein